MVVRNISKKIVLIGDGAVGKTSLIRKFVFDKFDDKYITTIGTKVTKKQLSLQSQGEEINLTLMIWDILGQKGYHSIQSKSYAGAAGGILVCDLTRRDTLQSIEDYWIPNFREVAGTVPMILLANKVDLLYSLEFSSDEMQMLVLGSEEVETVARRYTMPNWRSSAKTGENVEDAFLTLSRLLVGEPLANLPGLTTRAAPARAAPAPAAAPTPAPEPAAPRSPKVLRPEKPGLMAKPRIVPPGGASPAPASAAAPGPAPAAGAQSSLVIATEKIVADFSRCHTDAAQAQTFVNEVFDLTEVSRTNPTIKGMLTVIDRMAEDETKRLGMKDSRKNKRNRMLMIKESIGS